MQIDKYGESASFNIAGRSSYPSVYGTIISMLILAVAFPYGVNKFVVMKNYEDTNFQSITLENEISAYEEIGYDQTNFNVMLFFTNGVGTRVTKEQLEGYIEIHASINTVDKSGGNIEGSQETKSLVDCTQNDLDTKFFSPTDQMYERLEDSLCIENPEEIKFAGSV